MNISKGLNPEQVAAIQSWIENGIDLSGLQKSLSEHFDIRVTYMETRMLLLDLGLEIRKTPDPVPDLDEPNGQAVDPSEKDQLEFIPGSGVSLSLAAVNPPQYLVSGRVQFSDGEGALWYVDHSGQLGIEPDRISYRPSDADFREFQIQLREALSKY